MPLDSIASGPPQNGTDGFTSSTKAGSTFTSAKSLYSQAFVSVVPAFCIASQEL